MSTTQQELQSIFEAIGKKHGFETVTAEFAAFRDFKARWERGYEFIHIQMADYIMDAPHEAVEDLAEKIFMALEGCQCAYGNYMKNWVLAEGFAEKARPVYLKRSKNVARTAVGKHRNLSESLARLAHDGFIENNDDVYITWTRDELASRAGYCSALMKTIVISSVFDKEDVPNSVIDYVVLYNYLLIKESRRSFGGMMSDTFTDPLNKLPGHLDAKKWLSDHYLVL